MYNVYCLRANGNQVRLRRFRKRVNTLSEVARIMTDKKYEFDYCSKAVEPFVMSRKEHEILMSKCFAIIQKRAKE